MDRVFLDANVLFSAAYSINSGLLRLWRLPKATLLSSRYAVAEAQTNLPTSAQRERLHALAAKLELLDADYAIQTLPGITLPEKDRPKVRVIDPKGPWFKAEIDRVRAAKGADFTACDVDIPVEVK